MSWPGCGSEMVRTVDPSLLALRLRKLLWLARRRGRRALLRHGIAPSIEHDDLLAGRHFRSVVDVGANVGQFAIWAADVLGAEHIACVEPLPSAVERLREVVPRLAPCRVDVVVAALGSTPSRRVLNVTAATDSSSLLSVAAAARRRPALQVTATVEVDVLAGDDALPGPFEGPLLVKLDVQGAELDVLAGMPKLLAAPTPFSSRSPLRRFTTARPTRPPSSPTWSTPDSRLPASPAYRARPRPGRSTRPTCSSNGVRGRFVGQSSSLGPSRRPSTGGRWRRAGSSTLYAATVML